METVFFNDNQHRPCKARLKLILFLREPSSEMIPVFTWAPDVDGAEQAAKHPPSQVSSPAPGHSSQQVTHKARAGDVAHRL